MRKFLFTLIIFIFPILSIYLFFSIFYNTNIQKFIDSYEYSGKENILATGDSYLNSGINPQLYPNLKNIAQGGESYFYTYYKLRWFLVKENNIDTLLLGCSYHNFTNFWDDFLFEPKQTKEMFHRYNYFLDKLGMRILLKAPLNLINIYVQNKFHFPNEKKLKNLNEIKDNNFDINILGFMGGYTPHKSSNLKSETLERIVNNSYYKKKTVRMSSDIQKQYFLKIIKLCKTLDIDIILVSTPINMDLNDRIPIEIKLSYENILNNIENIKIINKSTMKLPDSCFYDYAHLNEYGATVFTKELHTILRTLE